MQLVHSRDVKKTKCPLSMCAMFSVRRLQLCKEQRPQPRPCVYARHDTNTITAATTARRYSWSLRDAGPWLHRPSKRYIPAKRRQRVEFLGRLIYRLLNRLGFGNAKSLHSANDVDTLVRLTRIILPAQQAAFPNPSSGTGFLAPETGAPKAP